MSIASDVQDVKNSLAVGSLVLYSMDSADNSWYFSARIGPSPVRRYTTRSQTYLAFTLVRRALQVLESTSSSALNNGLRTHHPRVRASSG